MRIGVIGCGYWGAKHVRVLHGLPEVDQVVLVEPDELGRSALARSFFGVRQVAALVDALDEVDAVVVATPAATHFDLAMEAIAAGKHVLVEKPLATTATEAEALVTAAAEAGVILMVGHTFEHNAAVWRLRDAVANGELGRVYYLDSTRLNLGPIRRDVNVVADLAPHDISIANFVLDSLPSAVTAWGSAHTHRSLEDTATLRLDYAELDVTATLRVSWLDPCKVRRTTVVGDRMMAVYNDMDDNERVKLYDQGVVVPLSGSDDKAPMSYRYGSIVAPYLAYREPLLVEDEDFVTSILTGSSPRTGGDRGVAVVRILDAAAIALRERTTVPITWPSTDRVLVPSHA